MRILQIASSLSLVLGFAACGGDGDDQGTPDAPGGTDGPSIDASPTAITLTGTATGQKGATAVTVAGAMIAAYRNSDESTPVGTATTDADGKFTLVLETGGAALDGYLKATHAEFQKETYLYPNTPISGDSAAPIIMVDMAAYTLLSNLGGGSQNAQNGLVALVVFDGTSSTAMPVAGATVASDPEIAATRDRYNSAAGGPSSTATSTAADGVAYLFNAPPDVNIMVSAAKTGATFRSHGLKARAGQFTTTFITP